MIDKYQYFWSSIVIKIKWYTTSFILLLKIEKNYRNLPSHLTCEKVSLEMIKQMCQPGVLFSIFLSWLISIRYFAVLIARYIDIQYIVPSLLAAHVMCTLGACYHCFNIKLVSRFILRGHAHLSHSFIIIAFSSKTARDHRVFNDLTKVQTPVRKVQLLKVSIATSIASPFVRRWRKVRHLPAAVPFFFFGN